MIRRSRSLRLGAALATVLLSACASSPATDTAADVPLATIATPAAPATAFTGEVRRHSDGDTLWIRVLDPGGTPIETRRDVKLRLLRIDTPELARDGDPAECLAEAATAALRELIPEGATVRGAYDVEQRDRFDRDLVHLWTADGTWVNGWLLLQGYATVVTFPPNLAHDDVARSLERAARAAPRGLWDPTVC